MEKVERDGKVAVLFSPGFGAGWYTWNSSNRALLFDPEIVEAVLADDRAKAAQIAERKWPDGYYGGAENLRIEWLDKGTAFRIDEYDGSESVMTLSDEEYITA